MEKICKVVVAKDDTIDSIKRTQRFHGEQLVNIKEQQVVIRDKVDALIIGQAEEKSEPPTSSVASDEPSSPPVTAPAVAPVVTTPEPVPTNAIPNAYNSTKKNKDALPKTPAGFYDTGLNVNDDDDDDF